MIHAMCKNCERDVHETYNGYCIRCLADRVGQLERALEKVGNLCLHTEASSIWQEVKLAVGEHGERYWMES